MFGLGKPLSHLELVEVSALEKVSAAQEEESELEGMSATQEEALAEEGSELEGVSVTREDSFLPRETFHPCTNRFLSCQFQCILGQACPFLPS